MKKLKVEETSSTNDPQEEELGIREFLLARNLENKDTNASFLEVLIIIAIVVEIVIALVK